MSDPFAYLPSTPAPPVTAPQPPEITVSDIKDFISPKLYGELSWDENRSADDVTKDCISRAVEFAKGLLCLVKEELNLFSKTQREVVKSLTVYELYLYNGDTTGAEKWLEKARDIISTRYKDIQKAKDERVPLAAITKRKN